MPQPNHRLRAAREQRRLSRNKLAETVALWLAERDPKGRDVAFDANHLGKIERGFIARPRDFYVAALCAVLGMTEAELGFDHESRATPEDVNRKAFLQAALGAGAGALMAGHFPDHDASDLVVAVAGATAQYGRMGDSVSMIELSPAVEAHVRLASSVVTEALPIRDGFAALGEAAVLAAWVARQRDDAGTARRHYREAVRCAERARHPLLTAFVLQARGTFAVDAGDPHQGLILLERARRELDEAGAPAAAYAHVASWLALAHAESGDRAEALGELRRAESLIDSNRGEPQWLWFLRFDAPKAARYRAATLAKLGDLTGARAAFAAAAPALATPRVRAKALADHAEVLIARGNLDEARALATEAVEIGDRFGYERIVRDGSGVLRQARVL